MPWARGRTLTQAFAAEASPSPRNERAAEAPPDEELFRGRIYGLLARLLAAPPDMPLLASLASLAGDDTELGRAFAVLAEAAGTAAPARVAEEYHDLFIGLTRGELLPYGSYYLTGFLNEKPLAELRGTLAGLGVGRADDVKEPEDHVAALCEVMAGLIDGAYGAPQPLAVQRGFFETHMAPWIGRFFADLEGADAAVFYAAVGRLGRVFVEIESTAFAMDA
jgi:TorA maturation chaperone TorD